MAKRLQHRGGTTAQHSTFTGAVREVTVDTDKNTLVVHDGATAGGHPLATLTGTETFQNKTLSSPTFSGTATNFTSTGIDDNATSTAITIDSSERVGIGTSSPSAKLDVRGSAVFNEDGSDVDFRVESSTDSLAFSVNGADGRVRIGSFGSNGKLNVSADGFSTSHLNPHIMLRNGNNTGGVGTGDKTLIMSEVTSSGGAPYRPVAFGAENTQHTLREGAFVVYVSDSQTVDLSTDERLRITNDGNVGIGTSSPSDTANRVTLELNDTWGGRIRNSIGGTANSEWSISTSNMALFGTIVSQPLAFTTNNLERMRIDSSGNLLINTTVSPSNHTNSLVIGENQNNPNSGGIFGHQMINKVFRTAGTDSTNFDITLTASSNLLGCFTVSVFGSFSSTNREGYAEYRVYCNRETNSIRTITVQAPVNENGSFTSGYSFSATKPSTSSIKFAITKGTGAFYWMIITGELADNRFTGATRSES